MYSDCWYNSNKDGLKKKTVTLLSIIVFIWITAIALLNKVASDLKRLTIENRCLVVTINHASNNPKRIPFLGRYWLHVPNVRLDSKRLSSNEFQLTVVTNVFSPVKEAQCTFRLPQTTLWCDAVLHTLKLSIPFHRNEENFNYSDNHDSLIESKL